MRCTLLLQLFSIPGLLLANIPIIYLILVHQEYQLTECAVHTLSQALGSYRFALLDISFIQSCLFTINCVQNRVFLYMLSIKSQGKLTVLTISSLPWVTALPKKSSLRN